MSIPALNFESQLRTYLDKFKAAISDDKGEWLVKGFIDVYRNVYTISVDTKVASKIIELMIFPLILKLAKECGYKVVLSEHQNHYPDATFVAADGRKYALDLKSTYRTSDTTANGFTLGAFTGYFRQRDSNKNVTFPYGAYAGHYVLDIIYSRTEGDVDEFKVFGLDDLESIVSVVRNFLLLIQPKWKLASARPGSGNTKNIGSVTEIDDLLHGRGPFSELGEDVFDDYWTNYMTADMALAIESDVKYRNLKEYFAWRGTRE